MTTTYQLVAVTSHGTRVSLIKVSAASKRDALQSEEAREARDLYPCFTIDAVPTINPAT